MPKLEQIERFHPPLARLIYISNCTLLYLRPYIDYEPASQVNAAQSTLSVFHFFRLPFIPSVFGFPRCYLTLLPCRAVRVSARLIAATPETLEQTSCRVPVYVSALRKMG